MRVDEAMHGAHHAVKGLFRELNPGPLAPEARIIPLDQTASCLLHQHYVTRGTSTLAPTGAQVMGVETGSWGPTPGQDTLAERLRRRPAKPMGSPRVGSNPTGVVVLPTKPLMLLLASFDIQKEGCSGN